MARPFAIGLVWAWTGFVSCDDAARVTAAVKAAVGEPDASVECQEPRLWYSERNWKCRSYLRGALRCFELHSLEEGRPWEVDCGSEKPPEGKPGLGLP